MKRLIIGNISYIHKYSKIIVFLKLINVILYPN